MGVVGDGASALGIYLSGASRAGEAQTSPARSLGGYRSAERDQSLLIWRLHSQAMAGLRILYASGSNGPGVGRIIAETADSLKWTPPGGEEGTAVTVNFGEQRVLFGGGDDAGKWVLVERTRAVDFGGAEAVQLLDTYNNVFGGSDFNDAESMAGAEKYRKVFLCNDSETSITDLTVWLDADNVESVQVSSETPSDGALVLEPDESTEPSGASWNSGTSAGAGLVIGTLAAGAAVGLLIEQSVGALAARSHRRLGIAHISWSQASNEYTTMLRGLHRVARNFDGGAPTQYELYIESEPTNPELHTPVETGTASPLVHEWSPAAGQHYVGRYARNAYGVASPITNTTIEIDGAGEELPVRPRAPLLSALIPAGDGAVEPAAVYYPELEDDILNRATHWVVYARADGIDPDPDVDTGVQVAMQASESPEDADQVSRGKEMLAGATTDPAIDNAPWRVLVRTRRIDSGGTTDSDNTEALSATGTKLGPLTPRLRAKHSSDLGQILQAAEAPSETVVYDEANDIRAVVDGADMAFYVDTLLIWRYCWSAEMGAEVLHINSELDLVSGSVSGAGTGIVETLSWTSGDKRIGLNVNGVRALVIDVSNGTIEANGYEFTGGDAARVAEIASTHAAAPLWARYADTMLQAWDRGNEQWFTVALLTAERLHFRVPVDRTRNQTEIEAL